MDETKKAVVLEKVRERAESLQRMAHKCLLFVTSIVLGIVVLIYTDTRSFIAPAEAEATATVAFLVVTRLAVIIFAGVIIRLLIGIIRYNLLLSNVYYAQADALELADDKEDLSLENLLKFFYPERLEFLQGDAVTSKELSDLKGAIRVVTKK